MTSERKPYPSDVCDEEWAIVAPYLMLLPEDAGQRNHSLREVFNGLRYVAKPVRNTKKMASVAERSGTRGR